MGKSIQELRQAPLPQDFIAFQENFKRDIPPGTVVWRNAQQREYGTTVDSALNPKDKIGIYDDPSHQEVWVNKINGQPNTWDSWEARGVVKKTEP